MTIFGKIVMGLTLLVIGTGVFYGVTSYVEKDSAILANEGVNEITNSTTTEESGLLFSITTATGTQATLGASGKKIPFTEFVSKGGSYTCTVTQTISDTTSVGMVYIHDAQLRVDFTTDVVGKSMKISTIIKDGYAYSWTSATPGKGQKTKIVSPTTLGTTSTTSAVWNSTQVGDYSCESWAVDNQMFELPKAVTFTLQ
jgi:hypothetical protein